MNLKQLEAFVKIANNNSFSQTAKELYLTQPTVSAYINKLERDLGVRLFARTTKEVELTDEGRQIYLDARKILELTYKIEHMFSKDEDEEMQQIVISASTIPGTYLLPGILANFNRKYPKTEFRINETDSSGVVQDIAEHKADLGFAGTITGGKNITFIPFYEDELVVVTPNTGRYREIVESKKGLGWITGEPWIMREGGSGTLKETFRLLEDMGIAPEELKTVARFSNTGTILMAVKEGIGIAAVSRLAAAVPAERGEVLCFPFHEEGAYRPLSMVVNGLYPQNESTGNLIRFVKEMYGSRA